VNQLRDRLEIHYTPERGSWLSVAVIELNVTTNHELSQRIPIPTIERMKKEVAA
jgi:hypothetical protein